ncbi:UDP-N-acetylenolpyruvoylglucosamine reductase [Thiohalorhabdus denitrificans]|uniref:UDP-N-acetylenolpyruvoylglucosamine reductase n=1 Tax=Thiohalorhabdus denitrificans TaxID=381306 RepID=A0A0P9C403_9GAMM|nr:UDP-N-acetylenolpyruvoylglucosamine reductase [Thiohalorhabdus denitrificans]SCY00655.1 UDP-N-acetylmuramate dehydrogenase [Thiohalorhabdus denitrificans]
MSAPAQRSRLRRDVPMAPRTTWRVGGAAERLFSPRTLEELQAFLASGEAVEPLLWVGHGSNLLVRDGGVGGTVICTRGGPKALERLADDRVRAEAGVSSARVARFCAEQGLAGAEFLAGIPGAIGGALAMNAGAYGAELADILAAVEVIDRRGAVRTADPAEFAFSYRHSRLPEGEWFVAAHLRLEPGDPEAIRERTDELLDHRGRTQPVNLANAGSVFRNPPGDHAARLIEAAGLKGTRLGGAEVSERHANFIVNRGQASAADIEGLIRLVQERVAEDAGVTLEPEVRIVGREP